MASRVFAFLQRTLLLLFSLSGSRDLCIGVHSMSVCVCGRAQVIRALFPVLVKYYCQFVFPSSEYATFFAKATFPLTLSYVHLAPSESKPLLRTTKTVHTNVLTSLIFSATGMDRSFHKVVSSHILLFAIAMRAFTSLEQSPSVDLSLS